MSFLGDSCASFYERKKTKPRRRRHWRVPGQRTPGPKVTFVSGSLITITQTGRTTSATARPRPLAQLQPSIGSGSLQRLNEGPVPCSIQQSILQAKGEQEREIVQREGVRTGGRGEPLSFVPHRSCLPAHLPRGSINLLQRIVATGN